MSDELRPTLGAHLEHVRLRRRARRVQSVIRALDERRGLYDGQDQAPAALDAALRDFRAELDEIDGRLRELEGRSAA